MGSDLARISFDKTRKYRSVVAQQGRVTLEADINEQASIASEALRLETIDIVGATGTPDNGYKVTVGKGAGGIEIHTGTMYVGGWRMHQDRIVHIGKQEDWLDQPQVDVNRDAPALVSLLVTEHSVSAVEDQALREVALGGPDTAARTRLMQHFVMTPQKADNCAGALKGLRKQLEDMGLVYHPSSCELTFRAALKVSFFPPTGPPDACCPPAQGGYLGSDNQMIQVTVTSYANGKGTLLWGWNNASFLYRASLDSKTAAPPVLTLSPAPVDSEHSPTVGKVVEVLRTTCVLGDPVDQNYVAALQGEVITLGAGSMYDPDFKQLTLPTGTTLPADYQDETKSLFVRLWEAEVPFTFGEPVQLDAVSGLAVTIEITALPEGQFAARPYWEFAVRPNTPQQVYPERFLEKLQGASGPRQWLCDLAVVELIPLDAAGQAQGGDGARVVADCRIPFVPLTLIEDEGGCCGITLGPKEVAAAGGLQKVVNAQAFKNQSLSLRPGEYVLEAPLALSDEHSGFVLSGCGTGPVVLRANANHIANFTPGLITIGEASQIKLENLILVLPLVTLGEQNPPPPPPPPPPDPTTVPKAEAKAKKAAATAAATTAATTDRVRIATLLGISALNADNLTIKGCEFVFEVPAATGTKAAARTLGAGIFAQGNCTGIKVSENLFTSPSGGAGTRTAQRMLAGLWMTPANISTDTGATDTKEGTNRILEVEQAQAAPGSYVIATNHLLDHAEISKNRFNGMTMATMVLAQLGTLRCTDNDVTKSCGGFLFWSAALGAVVELLKRALEDEKGTGEVLAATLRAVGQGVMLANAIDDAGTIIGTFPGGKTGLQGSYTTARPFISDDNKEVLAQNFVSLGSDAYKYVVEQNSTTQDPPPAANDPVKTAPAADATKTPAPAGVAAPAAAQTDAPAPDASAQVKANTAASKRAAKAAASAPPPPQKIDVDTYKQTVTAYEGLSTVGFGTEIVGTAAVPNLSLRHNTVALVPFLLGAQQDQDEVVEPSLLGISVILPKEDPRGAVFLEGNNVEVPNRFSIAVASIWGANTIVTGNLFGQVRAGDTQDTPCAVFLSADPSQQALMGNIVHTSWIVIPPRSVYPPSTWNFMNTIG